MMLDDRSASLLDAMTMWAVGRRAANVAYASFDALPVTAEVSVRDCDGRRRQVSLLAINPPRPCLSFSRS